MSDNKEQKEGVISSVGEAAEAIKKNKEKTKNMLDKIFNDNDTGRYSGPTDD